MFFVDRPFRTFVAVIIKAATASVAIGNAELSQVKTVTANKTVVANTNGLEKEFKQAEQINRLYLKTVRPIFAQKCFDCHSNQTKFPWYHSLPLVRGMLDNDITEAKSHLDMSDDFPFAGHGSAEEDLIAIRKDVDSNSMPPRKYWLIHWGSRLSAEEKREVDDWVESSLHILKSK